MVKLIALYKGRGDWPEGVAAFMIRAERADANPLDKIKILFGDRHDPA